MESSIPRREEWVLPAVRHRKDIIEIQMFPILVPHAFPSCWWWYYIILNVSIASKGSQGFVYVSRHVRNRVRIGNCKSRNFWNPSVALRSGNLFLSCCPSTTNLYSKACAGRAFNNGVGRYPLNTLDPCSVLISSIGHENWGGSARRLTLALVSVGPL